MKKKKKNSIKNKEIKTMKEQKKKNKYKRKEITKKPCMLQNIYKKIMKGIVGLTKECIGEN